MSILKTVIYISKFHDFQIRQASNLKIITQTLNFIDRQYNRFMNTIDIAQQKRELRAKVKSIKKQISVEEKQKKSKQILTKIEREKNFIDSNTVMIYWSMDDEVFTHDFVKKWAAKKQIILPSVRGDNLILKTFNEVESMIDGEKYGIPEPKGDEYSEKEKIELIIVPGVAFDKQNNRMGRGKAYYDKLLKTTKAYKIGICFDFQLFDNVPTDEFDIKMDKVISG